jgi:CDP-paratose 2-epimerase
MSVAIITGSAGLIGSQACKHFASLGLTVVGIDNDMRSYYFGKEASTSWMRERLQDLPGYRHHDVDVRDRRSIFKIFERYGKDIALVIHAAAQPSHDWAAKEPFTDFEVNAVGTLNLLQAARQHAGEAPFIFMSTNKVYGDAPNSLPLIEEEVRWEIDPEHAYRDGIDESMSVDHSMHSIFGASKLAADIMVQEYGKYFGMRTVSFRGGCLTGPDHSGTQLHGFLAYLMKCCAMGVPYQVLGYKGKQVRDNIHSADLICAFDHFWRNPRSGEAYNMGGSRFGSCSMLEAIGLCQEISGKKLKWSYVESSRQGDHVWWISDVSRFRSHYPGWNLTYNVETILREIYDATQVRSLKGKDRGRSVSRNGKKSVAGILIDSVDYESTITQVMTAAKNRSRLTVSALAVHGVMTGVLDREHRYRLNCFDLLVPDGQPVRWALNFLHKTGLKERVYGPELTLRLLQRAESEGVPLYLYGSTEVILRSLKSQLHKRFPSLRVAGAEASRFRQISAGEKAEVQHRIQSSGARMVLLGIGCPRQEVWTYEFGEALSMPIVAVGAAFPLIAGVLPQAPKWMQDKGLEWLFRLLAEPRRLWRRYVFLNPAYLALVFLQIIGFRYETEGKRPQRELRYG